MWQWERRLDKEDMLTIVCFLRRIASQRLIILLAFITQAHTKELRVHHMDVAHESLGKLVHKLVSKLFEQAPHLRHADLENTTLAKSSHFTTIPSRPFLLSNVRSVVTIPAAAQSRQPHSIFAATDPSETLTPPSIDAGAVAGQLRPSSAQSQSPSSPFGQSDPINKEDGEELKPGVRDVGHIIAVASCKGGVGKSTTAVNFAYALAASGKRVGIVDLDIYGSSLPTIVRPDGQLETAGESLKPLEMHGVKLMSMGFLNPGTMPLRGTRVIPIVQQLVGRTVWGKLDYLIADLPPGTGDVQLTLSQDFRVSAAVLVTTPQRLSFVDVVKGVEMFHKVGIPTVAVMENMNGLRNDRLVEAAEKLIEQHGLSEAAASDLLDLLGNSRPIFGDSHVQQLKERWGITASFSLPLLPAVAASADNGVPIVVSAPESGASAVYMSLAKAVDKEVSSLATVMLPLIVYSEEDKLVHALLRDGSEETISPIELRKLCRSPTNNPSNLPADLHPLQMTPMGNYAILVTWSDGHRQLQPYRSFVHGCDT